MQKAFTMIELVFVIVILGILASVAIPKLAATRDDAEIMAGIQRASNLITDLGSYYTAKGKFDSNISQMTNEFLVDNTNAIFTGDITTTPAYFGDTARTKRCLKVSVSDMNGTLTFSDISDSSVYCQMLVKQMGKFVGTHKFGGSAIYE